MRLDKFLSHASGLTRSASRRAIKGAGVLVNNVAITDPKCEVDDSDTVVLHGEPLRLPGPLYLMLHKPEGYVSATTDSEHPTVIDLLKDLSEPQRKELSIAGRLDRDTTGLVLLSNDGQWIHRLTSPRHQHPKTYVAELHRPVEQEDIEAFARGIMLRSESRPTLPAELKPLPHRRAEITLYEGRYHQVKRMFAATGNVVLALHRNRIGEIHLDDDLPKGRYRPLSDQEIASVP